MPGIQAINPSLSAREELLNNLSNNSDPRISDISRSLSEHFIPATSSPQSYILAPIAEDPAEEELAERQSQLKTAKSVNCCVFFLLLVPGMLEATAVMAHLKGDISEKEISAMLKNRNLFYGSIGFIAYGITSGSALGIPILMGGTALGLKNLAGLYSRAKVYQAHWIG